MNYLIILKNRHFNYYFDKIKSTLLSIDFGYAYYRFVFNFTTTVCACNDRPGHNAYFILLMINQLYLHTSVLATFLLQTETLAEKLETSLYVFYSVLGLTWITLYMKKTDFLDLVNDMSAIYDDNRITKKDRRRLKTEFRFCVSATILYGLFTVALFLPLLRYFFLSGIDRPPRTFLYTPYRLNNNSFVYSITAMVQSTLIHVHIIAGLAVALLHFHLADIIADETERLLTAIGQLDSRYEDDDRSYLNSMKSCCRHHRAIVRFAVRVIDCFRQPAGVATSLLSFTIALNLYAIVVNFDGDAGKLFERTTGIAISISIIFSVCHAGQLIFETNRQFGDAIYACKWYEKSIAVQRFTYTVLLTGSSWNLSFGFTPRKVLNYAMFVGIVNFSYTLFTFLLRITFGTGEIVVAI